MNKERGSQSLWHWFRSSRQSELLVVFAEDVAALGGLTTALVFIGLALATGNPVWDAVGSICIGVLLVLVALLVGIEVKVAVKARMKPVASAEALITAINAIEKDFRVAFPQVHFLFFEPDLKD